MEIMEEYTAKAQAEAEKIKTGQAGEYQTTREKAAQKMEEAAGHIMERIVGGKWQS
jgi:F0F1-type ATP synthase membrane subunit b/b'